jgi:hypothetical protein
MFISLSDSRSNGFKKWSDQHPHSDGNDDDQLWGTTPAAIAAPPIGGSASAPDSSGAESRFLMAAV